MAATGDLHCNQAHREEIAQRLGDLRGRADLLLLAGDLTSYGEPAEAAVLAEICSHLEIPTFAVLGNHDWHADRREELVSELEAGSIQVLQGRSVTVEIAGHAIGLVGTKGFVGGFTGHSHLDDFGEPALRELYRLTTREVQALDRGLREIALCPIRVVLLHYSPTVQTLAGEPPGIWAFLGSDRLAAPIAEHEPDIVLHGHAHAGARAGEICGVPVHNVSMDSLKEAYVIFELHARERTSATIH